MRILLDARTVGKEFSGVGNYVQELVGAFAELDEDHEFVLCVRGASRLRDRPLDERFRLLEVPFSHESHPLGDLWEHFVLPRIAARRSVDVIHGPAFLIPTGPTPMAKVVTVHDLVAFVQRETIPRRYALYMRWLIRRAVRAADRVLTDSESVRRNVLQVLHADPARVEAIPLGVSSRFVPAVPAEVERIRARLGLVRPYLLFVGNLEPRKNLPGLLAAFRRLQRRHPGPIELAVAGQIAWKSGPLVAALAADDLEGSVRRLGYVAAEDLPALYSGAEAFVFPTFWEGFGLPVLEAMACGTPVVASNTSSIPEVAGDAAVLVDPASPEAIAEGILGVIGSASRAAELRRAGLDHAARFGWRRTALGTLAAYRAAAAARGR
jgi:glycosyltransferase involved in cell wall biosynthesis